MRVADPVGISNETGRGGHRRHEDLAGQDSSIGLIDAAAPSAALTARAYRSMIAELIAVALDELAAELEVEARHGGQHGPGLALAALILRDRASETLTQTALTEITQ